MIREETTDSEAGLWKKRLLTYSAAAGAALTMAGPADAAVRYSGTKYIQVNNTNPVQYIDINGDGIIDFAFSNLNFTTYPYFFIQGVFMFGGTTGNSILGALEPYRLSGGEIISSGAPGSWYSFGVPNMVLDYGTGPYDIGNFISRAGYMGVRFYISGNTHYGWIAYEGAGYTGGRITGWAYEDRAGTAIAAGDTGIEPIPTLNQWGIIFLMGLIVLEGARRIKRSRDTD